MINLSPRIAPLGNFAILSSCAYTFIVSSLNHVKMRVIHAHIAASSHTPTDVRQESPGARGKRRGCTDLRHEFTGSTISLGSCLAHSGYLRVRQNSFFRFFWCADQKNLSSRHQIWFLISVTPEGSQQRRVPMLPRATHVTSVHRTGSGGAFFF